MRRTDRRPAPWALAALVLMALFPARPAGAADWDNVGHGVMVLPSQSPFDTLRLSPLARTPETPDQGRWEVLVSETLANIWSYEPGRFLLDYEMLTSDLLARYGLTGRTMLELGFEERRLFGGALDGLIVNFHKTLGVDQDGRNRYPENEVYIRIKDRHEGRLVSSWEGGSAAYSQSFSATLMQNLTRGTGLAPAVSLAATLRHDTWDAGLLDREGEVDAALTLALSKRLGPVYAYLSPSWAYYGSERLQGVELRKFQASGLLALEWRFVRPVSLVVQYLITQGAARDLRPFSQESHEIVFGFKGGIGRNLLWEFGLIENLVIYDNSPDFGAHAGLSLRF